MVDKLHMRASTIL